jgi:excisionase family DNA binding protein
VKERIGHIHAFRHDSEQAEPEWWDIRRAACYLGMSVAFLRKRVRLREVPFVRVGTKALRFRQADLDAWLNASSDCATARLGPFEPEEKWKQGSPEIDGR